MKAVFFIATCAVALGACSSSPPPADWQLNAKGSADRFAEAYFAGDNRVAAAELERARAEVSRTARPDVLARVELLHCALRVAALDFEPCTGFDPLAEDAAPPEQAYARYLRGELQGGDVALLPAPQQAVAAAGAAPDAALSAVQDPTSQLVAAGVLMRTGQATPVVIAQAVETASARGWRRPLLAWLGVALKRAEAAGNADDVARLRRRVSMVEAASPP